MKIFLESLSLSSHCRVFLPCELNPKTVSEGWVLPCRWQNIILGGDIKSLEGFKGIPILLLDGVFKREAPEGEEKNNLLLVTGSNVGTDT
jgi:hypothetical protein